MNDTIKGLMFFVWVGLAIFFLYVIYEIVVLRPERIDMLAQESEADREALDRRYCADPEQAAYDPRTCDKFKT